MPLGSHVSILPALLHQPLQGGDPEVREELGHHGAHRHLERLLYGAAINILKAS